MLQMKRRTNNVDRETGKNRNMSAQSKPSMSGNPRTYPEKTKGSEAASNVRKLGNSWSERKREELFEQGMQIIYGGSGNKAKVRS